MILFIDTEFNQWQGELISMALVSELGEKVFYEVVEFSEEPKPWIKENVLPILNKKPIPYREFQTKLKTFLSQFAKVHLIADYPDDLAYFCQVVITGPGEWFEIPLLTMEVDVRLTAKGSKVPHNALEDAQALRRHWAKLNFSSELLASNESAYASQTHTGQRPTPFSY